MRKSHTWCSAAVLVLLAWLPAFGLAQAKGLIEGSERKDYIATLQQLHATQTAQDALLAQINLLLKQNALLSGYQVGFSEPQDIVYSLSVQAPGELRIRTQLTDTENGRIQGRLTLLNVFGMGHDFSYDCQEDRLSCSVRREDSSAVLLRIVRNPQAAAELAQAMSYLVREMQRSSQ